jgi:hypothetical protein
VEFFMQKASRTQPVLARDGVETNVVRLARTSASTPRDGVASPAGIASIAALMERASIAVRQMKYFSLAARRFTFDELTASATRAGFIPIMNYSHPKEASFRWGAGEPDLIFTATYQDAARVSIVAETQADIFGLILTAYSQASTISVEANPMIEDKELGRNALMFRDMLLTFPGFEDVPAWTSYPEVGGAEAGGLVEMWRDGVCVASVFGRAWNSISTRVLTIWPALRDRS